MRKEQALDEYGGGSRCRCERCGQQRRSFVDAVVVESGIRHVATAETTTRGVAVEGWALPVGEAALYCTIVISDMSRPKGRGKRLINVQIQDMNVIICGQVRGS